MSTDERDPEPVVDRHGDAPGKAGDDDTTARARIPELRAEAPPVAAAGRPADEELTLGEAATFLGVPRPWLVETLDRERVPYRKVNSRRRIRLEDVQHLKARMDAGEVRYTPVDREERRQLLREISDLGGHEAF